MQSHTFRKFIFLLLNRDMRRYSTQRKTPSSNLNHIELNKRFGKIILNMLILICVKKINNDNCRSNVETININSVYLNNFNYMIGYSE